MVNSIPNEISSYVDVVLFASNFAGLLFRHDKIFINTRAKLSIQYNMTWFCMTFPYSDRSAYNGFVLLDCVVHSWPYVTEGRVDELPL